MKPSHRAPTSRFHRATPKNPPSLLPKSYRCQKVKVAEVNPSQINKRGRNRLRRSARPDNGHQDYLSRRVVPLRAGNRGLSPWRVSTLIRPAASPAIGSALHIVFKQDIIDSRLGHRKGPPANS